MALEKKKNKKASRHVNSCYVVTIFPITFIDPHLLSSPYNSLLRGRVRHTMEQRVFTQKLLKCTTLPKSASVEDGDLIEIDNGLQFVCHGNDSPLRKRRSK
jgi:hypothetical protein